MWTSRPSKALSDTGAGWVSTISCHPLSTGHMQGMPSMGVLLAGQAVHCAPGVGKLQSSPECPIPLRRLAAVNAILLGQPRTNGAKNQEQMRDKLTKP